MGVGDRGDGGGAGSGKRGPGRGVGVCVTVCPATLGSFLSFSQSSGWAAGFAALSSSTQHGRGPTRPV